MNELTRKERIARAYRDLQLVTGGHPDLGRALCMIGINELTIVNATRWPAPAPADRPVYLATHGAEAYLSDLGMRIHAAVHSSVADASGNLILGDDDMMQLDEVVELIRSLRSHTKIQEQTMSTPLASLMRLQGDIKIRFMEMGQSQDAAHELASEALHMLAESDAVRDEVREAYRTLGASNAPATT